MSFCLDAARDELATYTYQIFFLQRIFFSRRPNRSYDADTRKDESRIALSNTIGENLVDLKSSSERERERDR